jgi:PST family polysaccharide transporter
MWLFQGMEKMKYITYVNISAKLIFTVAIFLFVHSNADFYLVPIFTSVGFIIAGIWSLIVAKQVFLISFKMQTKKTLIFYFKDGWHMFVASISGNLYGQGNIIILGLFTTPTIVGYYSVGAKIASAVVGIFLVVTQTIFPHLVKLKNENFNIFKKFIKHLFVYTSLINILLVGVLMFMSNDIYTLITGTKNEIGFYSFSFWLVITFLTIYNVVFNPIIVALRQDKFMSKMYLFIGISFLLFGSILTHQFDYKGMLFSMLIVELFILIISIIAIKSGLKIKK